MKILNLKLHQKIFLFTILINLGIAILDFLSMKSEIFGTPQDYTSGLFSVCNSCSWWNLFFYFNLISIILISLSYFFFDKRHDKSESFSIFAGSIICWFTFLPDFFFFIIQKKFPPEVLPWLNNGILSGKVLPYLGGQMTNFILYGFVIIGLFISYFTIKFLVKRM